MTIVRSRWGRAFAVVAGVALAATPVATAGASEEADLAPLLGADGARVIADRYIVVLDEGSSDQRVQEVAALATASGGTIHYSYTAALKGFAATMAADGLSAVRAAAGVDFVEADGAVSLSPPGEAQKTVRTQPTQPNPTWGLDRVDQRNLPLNNNYVYDATGRGVRVYIIDTGIRFSHNEFGGRATSGYDAIDGGSADDCNGHGTHVAGTVGGTTYGVAKKAKLIAVRVLDCGGSGSWAGVIAGVDWVTANAPRKAVANMSLGGAGSLASLENAVTASIDSGVPYAIAAGNDGVDACGYTPARTPKAITVGASDITDWETWFSNYGPCLDIWGPGDSITSAWHTSNSATNTISGTSMAAPHVAGVAALYVEKHPGASSDKVRNELVQQSSKNKLNLYSDTSPNKLVYSRVI